MAGPDASGPPSGAAPALPLLSPGDVLLGKYRVTRLVGEGGMGQVFAATHVELDQQVAIKILLPDRAKDGEAVGRFLREARAVALLRSAHVARVFDVGTSEGGLPFMIMELLEGEDLATLVDRHGPLPYGEVVDAVLQACDAIAEAHANGIIHRDIKPENLFVTARRDGLPLVKVLDFGISKIGADPSAARKRGRIVTQDNVVLGSPGYMSPEQVKSSAHVDERSDVWSLGVTLYELLTGRDAFHGESVPDIFVSILTSAPASPSSLVPGVPEDLGAVVLRCLEKQPAARFQSVAELAKALVPFATRTPSSIAPSWTGRAAESGSSLVAKITPISLEPLPLSSNGLAATIAERKPSSWRRALVAAGVALVVGILVVAGLVVRRARARDAPSAAVAPSALGPPTAAAAPSASHVEAAASVDAAAPLATASEAPEPPASAAPAPAKATKAKSAPRKSKGLARPATRAAAPAKPAIAPTSLPRERTPW